MRICGYFFLGGGGHYEIGLHVFFIFFGGGGIWPQNFKYFWVCLIFLNFFIFFFLGGGGVGGKQ